MRYILFAIVFGCAAASAFADIGLQFIINGTKLTPVQLSGMGEMPNRCTATLIGPRLVITAAHCVVGPGENDVDLDFLTPNGRTYQATFVADPLYDAAHDGPLNIPNDFASKHDIALGVLNEPATGIDMLTVTAAEPKLGDIVMFAGRGAPTFERMYGLSKIVTVSANGFTMRGFGQMPQAVDGGDSGGPSLLVDSAGHVSIFSVHSTSTRERDESSTLWAEALPYTMGDARVFPKDNTNFLKDYAAKNNLQICGVNLSCKPVAKP